MFFHEATFEFIDLIVLTGPQKNNFTADTALCKTVKIKQAPLWMAKFQMTNLMGFLFVIAY